MFTLCPCRSGKDYQHCCQPLHLGKNIPQNAEQLMRSRYCAFVTGDTHYIFATHSPESRSHISIDSIKQWNEQCEWLALQINPQPKTDIVDFVAWFKQEGSVSFHHEISRFVHQSVDEELAKRLPANIEKSWYYLDAEYPQNKTSLPKRNDNCICQSGKKFKKCCGA